MVQDVMQHYLKPGQSRETVLALLGPPYQEKIERQLPADKPLPDSLDALISTNRDPAKSAALIRQINAFYQQNARPDTVMLYPVGWSTIDPNFLVIRLSGKGKVKRFWKMQG